MHTDKYELVIGLEVHVQLLTKSKLFCGDSAAFTTAPNTHVSPITLAHPGTLPKMNSQAITFAIRLGLALHCDIARNNYFARKNYFYPDLPKGYQGSQHTTPICSNGFVTIKSDNGKKQIRLNRIHIEEDAGKSIHDQDDLFTCIDLNRAGVPLLEIVSEPVLHSSDEAFAYLTELRKLVRWLDICDGNMEEGSMRCDANISIRPKGATYLGTRVEVKNLNSIRNVKRAIEVEAARLMELSENNQPILQETRSFDADNGTTFSLRTKEDAEDYRYFPEPDLSPFHITEEQLTGIKRSLPALPEVLEEKFRQEYGLSEYDAHQLCETQEQADYFEAVTSGGAGKKSTANWLLGPVKSYCNENNIDISAFPLSSETLAGLVQLTDSGKISFGNASGRIMAQLIKDPAKDPLAVAVELNLLQEQNDDSLEAWVNDVINRLPDKVQEYRKGKKGVLGLFAGEVKKLSKGKADMQRVTQLLEEKLKS